MNRILKYIMMLMLLSTTAFATTFRFMKSPLSPERGIRYTGTNSTVLDLTSSDIGGILDITDFKGLATLTAPSLPITHLRANGLSLLSTLNLTSCPNLTDIDLSGDIGFTSIDLNGTWSLTTVTNLNVSGYGYKTNLENKAWTVLVNP